MIKPGLCVGLDSSNYLKIINTVKADVFKVNPAFNPGETETIAKILNSKNIRWIYDAKLWDVPHTNKAYAKYVFETLGASGVTLNPFVGLDALQPFFDYKDKTSFILCKTTNHSNTIAQDFMYQDIIKLAEENHNIGIVHSSEGLPKIKSIILCPGIGAQSGKIRARSNVLYSVSRSIIKSENPRKKSVKYYNKVHSNLIYYKLIKEKYVKFGKFTLSSGIESDFYVDLKAITKDIDLFKRITEMLSTKVSNNRVLGIESGSISLATSVALNKDASFGFVRKQAKNYATKNCVEALEESNEPVTIVDDVLTTGKSVFNAIQVAKNYNITEIIVVVERGTEAREMLEALGYTVRSLIKISSSHS